MTTEYACCAVAAPIAPPPQPEPPSDDPSMTRHLRLLLQWRDDVENPEMIQGDTYDKHHLAMTEDHLTDAEVGIIVDLTNAFYRRMGSPKRVAVVQKRIFKPFLSGPVATILN